MMKQFTFTLIISLLFIGASFGQQTKIGAFGEIIVIPTKKVEEISTNSKESVNPMPPGAKRKGLNTEVTNTKGEYRYMSYKIQILSSETPIDLADEMFTLYSDVSFNQTKAEGFTYFQGDYSDEAKAKAALEKIREKYPDAVIVKERRYLEEDQKPKS